MTTSAPSAINLNPTIDKNIVVAYQLKKFRVLPYKVFSSSNFVIRSSLVLTCYSFYLIIYLDGRVAQL